MNVLVKYRAHLLAAFLAVSGATLAHAQVQPPAPDYLAPALPHIGTSTGPQSRAVREVSLTEAQLLLRSPDGDLWRVFSVHAPAHTAHKSRYAHWVNRSECQSAMKFARTHKSHAYCTALYTHSTVLLASTASR